MGNKSVDQGTVDANTQKGVAQQQSLNKQNVQTQAAYNRPNQTNAFGNSTNWVQTGTDANGDPTFSQNQTLGATGQQYSTGLTGLGKQYMEMAGQGIPDSTAALDKAEQFATARLDRQKGIAVDALDNKLKNQGLVPGTPAYDEAMRSTLDSYGDQRNTMTAQLQNQFFNQGLQGRQQQVSELQPGITFGFNNALNTNQAAVPAVNVGNVDYGALNNAAFNQQNEMVKQHNANNQAMIGGLAALGGGIIGGPMGAMAAKSMFGGGGSSTQPGTYANGGWSTTTTPANGGFFGSLWG